MRILENEKTLSVQVIEATTANGVCSMRIKALALPGAVATALDENADLMRITLASCAAPSSPDQPTAELPQNSQAAEDDNHTATATATATDIHIDTDTDRNAIKDTSGGQKQHQPSRLDSGMLSAAAAAPNTGGGSVPPTAKVALDSSGQNHANGHTSSSSFSGAAHEHCAHGSDSGSSGSIDNNTSTAEDPSEAERVDTPQPGRGDPSLGSGTDSRGVLHGSKSFKSSTGEASHNIDSIKEGATAAPINSADQQCEEEGQSIASGKIGILKQRLLAAVKDAKADSPALLKVSVTLPALLLQGCPPPPAPPPFPPPSSPTLWCADMLARGTQCHCSDLI